MKVTILIVRTYNCNPLSQVPRAHSKGGRNLYRKANTLRMLDYLALIMCWACSNAGVQLSFDRLPMKP